MCGIIGYIGEKKASDVIVEGLKYLEYRGYDSAGVAVLNDGEISVEKKEGRIVNLENSLAENPLEGHLAIGHTRWATHGKPSDKNAHPFIGNKRRYAVVHNGIIENYLELKEELIHEGVRFNSKTDSEVIVHLLEKYENGTSVVKTIQEVVRRLKGAFALGIICVDSPDVLYAVKRDNPLIIGIGDNEGYICSDINSLQNFVDKVVVLDNKQIAKIERGSVKVYDFRLNELEYEVSSLSRSSRNSLGEYKYYMDKEIHEIPTVLKLAIENYRNNKCFEKIDQEYLKSIKRINIVGCGTALHAGYYGERLIKKYLPDIDVYSEMASEFRYNEVKVDDKTLTITISQSGETADTLTCQKMVKKLGGKTLTVCNVPTSSMVHEADYFLELCAGQEIAVASTKAYNCQDLMLALFVFDLARLRGSVSAEKYDELQSDVDKLSGMAQVAISAKDNILKFAEDNFTRKSVFYLGRGIDYCVAMEGSLKLKEISYIHCEAYAAGELKHGTLALIEKDVLTIGIITRQDMVDKMASSLAEVKTRGADVLVITPFVNNTEVQEVADYIIKIPYCNEDLSPIISVIPTQLISYYISRAKGCDIDKPRNLAKSVTVE